MARVVDVRELTVRLHAPIRNAVIDFTEMTGSLVAVVSDVVRDGANLTGFAFNSVGRYAQGESIRDRFGPRLLRDPEVLADAEALDPRRVRDVLMANEKPGGHGDRSTAVAAIELATWDLAAKLVDLPAYAFIAEAYGATVPSPRVAVYAAGGYYAEDDRGGTRALVDEIRAYLDLGYEDVKIKIGGASLSDDLRRIEAVLAIVGDGSRLAVDANGRFDVDAAIRYGEALEPYGLKWFEEPGDPLDFELQARLGQRCAGPFATGENLFSREEVRNLLRYAGLDPAKDVVQVDPGWSYGIDEFHAILGLLDDFGWNPKRVYPHGGNLMTLHLTAGLGLGGSEAYPGVFHPFGGYAHGTEVRNGGVEIPDAPGFGFERKDDLRPLLAELCRRGLP